MVKAEPHAWEFKARFRRVAFGGRSQPAIQRIKQAVSEIKKVARRDPVIAADGAVCLLERLSSALERVDSSSGAIGTAVHHAITELVPIIARAPADAARDLAQKQSAFAFGAGLLALQWLGSGHGYDITGADVWAAYQATLTAAEHSGTSAEARRLVKEIVAQAAPGGFVTRVLGRELGL